MHSNNAIHIYTPDIAAPFFINIRINLQSYSKISEQAQSAIK